MAFRTRLPRRQGSKKSKLYSIWQAMRTRCTNPNHDKFWVYGGAGITVHADWLKSFAAFREWAVAELRLYIGEYSEISLDRRNPEAGYFPYNCRFIPLEENHRQPKRRRA